LFQSRGFHQIIERALRTNFGVMESERRRFYA